ncbi:hypothetical protein NQ314_018063 [Rhamnusium bicolor]|uniref:BESS domain-containing protein n=1 Tax=Rhamnusium bicolor TaxID=1586634 RepID=A0AAV8WTB4_9CUCU|nr:hypothetical protein NQ314_018063 [Rhamnusium bicolor]
MSANDIDVDVFISEIENRPALWDMRCDLYSDRSAKTKAWEEVCLMFVPYFEKMTIKEKNTAEKHQERVWSIISERIHILSTTQFLALAETRRESEDVERVQDLSSSVTTVDRRCSTKKRKLMSEVEKTELELLKNITKKMVQQDDDDSDKSDSRFLLSLLPEFRSIKEEFKLDLKMEMLSLIKKYKNLNIQPHYQNQPQYGYSNQSQYGYSQTQVASRVFTNLTSSSASGVSGPPREFSIERNLYAPGPSHNYAQREVSTPISSHNYDNASTVPAPTPSPAISTSVHSLSDNKNEVCLLIVRIKAADQKLESVSEKVLPTVSEEHLENECIRILEYEDEATDVARFETWLLSLSGPSQMEPSNSTPQRISYETSNVWSNMQPTFETTADILEKSFYVDDLIVSLQTEEHARQFYNETVEVLSKANMNIRKLCSNDERLRHDFNGQASEVNTLEIKYIGLDPRSIMVNNEPITKRQVLRTISSIF